MLVSNLKWTHSILLCIGLLCSASTQAINNGSEDMGLVKDSLTIDQSNITPKFFSNLKERYGSDEFNYDQTINNNGLWSRFKQWFIDFIQDLFNLKSAGEASKMADIGMKIFYVVIFLLVIYFIVKAVMNNEGQWVFGKSSAKKIIPVTDIENNIHATDFKSLIAEAESVNNFRLAIRYYYLWLLKVMTEAEWIEYDVEKTNSDYQNEIKSKSIREEFAYTSYLYNYIWYGEFNVTDEQFYKAKTAFDQFLNSVRS